MATVHLLSAVAGDPERDAKALLDLEQMRASAEVDAYGEHLLADDPGQADLVLFVETGWAAGHYFQRVRSHPVARRFRAKSYLFSSADGVVPFLPGVFASIERRWAWRAWTRSGGFLGVKEGDGLRYAADHAPSELFSFVGAVTADPVRRGVAALRHPRAIVVDTAAEARAIASGERPALGQDRYRERYARSIRDCAFVLCPRGGGTATFRLFEAMMLGRAPVIVSDQWVPPAGPDWDRFSVRVAEKRVDSIPALLEAREHEAADMGRAAREAWIEWFSPQAFFHRTVNSCLELEREAPSRAGMRRYAPYAQMLRPYHAARAVVKRLGHGG
jgi:hypothetical protein